MAISSPTRVQRSRLGLARIRIRRAPLPFVQAVVSPFWERTTARAARGCHSSSEPIQCSAPNPRGPHGFHVSSEDWTLSKIRKAREEFLNWVRTFMGAAAEEGLPADARGRLKAGDRVPPFWNDRGFREIGDTLDEGVIAVDAADRVVYLNSRAAELLGMPIRELLGLEVGDLIAPTDHTLYRAQVTMQRRGRTDRLEMALRGTGSTLIPAYVSMRPVFGVRGRLEGHALTFSRAAHAPTGDLPGDQSHTRVHGIVEHSASALYVRTPQHVLTYASPGARQLLACAPTERPASWTESLTRNPANRAGVELARKAGDTGHRQRPFEVEIARPDGRTSWIQVRETPVTGAEGSLEIVGELTDVTDRRRLETLLQIERDLGAAIGSARTLSDATRHVLQAALAAEEVDAGWLYLVDAASGDLVLHQHRGLSDAFAAAVDRILATAPRAILIRETSRRRIEVVDPEALDEGYRTVMWFPIRIEGRLLACLNLASRRVDAFHPATLDALETAASHLSPLIAGVEIKSSLDSSKSTLDSLVSSAPAGIGVVRDRTFAWVNDYMVRRTGYPAKDLLGRSARLLYLDDAEFERVGRELEEQIGSSGIASIETKWRRRDGSMIDVLVGAAARDGGKVSSEMVFTAWDVTERNAAEEERRRLERQVQQAQKMESLGLLAGGVAHDFNNLLHAIMGHASMAGHRVAPSDEAGPHLDAIERAASRAGELCRQMLAYSGRGSFVIERVYLGELVTDLISMLDVSLAKGTELCIDVKGDTRAIEADASQMRQVVMNLITNAAESIGGGVGLVRVTVAPAQFSRERLHAEFWQSGLEPGMYVQLRVEDNGCGMDAQTRERIFEPFFTTKFTGRGLGLAAIQGIVRGHGGAIRVASELGRGTTVTVLVPEASGKVMHQEDAPPVEAPLTETGVILLADDELPVRELESMMLETAGFEVVAVDDGLSAVEVFQERPNDFQCVILDLTMPVMDGEQAFRAIREIRPNVPVILCSGFSAQELDQRFDGDRPAGFLEKPFRADALLGLIGQITPGRS